MKSLFNFYLDDDLKKDCQNKLMELCGDRSKGQLASLIRVLLRQFVGTKTVNPLLLDAIAAEYEFSQTKNKRSRM